MTRIQKINEINESIESLKAKRDALLVAGKVSEARGYASKIESKLADRQGIENELYEKFGVAV